MQYIFAVALIGEDDDNPPATVRSSIFGYLESVAVMNARSRGQGFYFFAPNVKVSPIEARRPFWLLPFPVKTLGKVV